MNTMNAEVSEQPIVEVRETYVAVQQLLSAHNDQAVLRQPDDEMPEAHEWPWQIRDSYLRNHRIKTVTVAKRTAGRPRKDQS